MLPFDRVKSLLQVSEAARRQGALAVTRHVISLHGFSGLYQGGMAHMLIACVRCMRAQINGHSADHVRAHRPYTVFYYSLYDELLSHGKVATSAHGPGGHPLLPLLAATAARTVETAARQPLERAASQLQPKRIMLPPP